jgi:methionine biosynthesis protein MetW
VRKGQLVRAVRADFSVIGGWIPQNGRVLDLGCGDGGLLAYLRSARGATGYGIDIDDAAVLACIGNGVPVIQRDLEAGLKEFGDASFDCVILSQALQQVRRIEPLVDEMLRVGREGIVAFPNFAYWKHRLNILAGRMPVSEALPYSWYDTPNIHLTTVRDFDEYCARHAIAVADRIVLHGSRPVRYLPRAFGSLAIYRIRRDAR